MPRSIDDVLVAARRTLAPRPGPTELEAAMDAGALVVDIRPLEQRCEYGGFPGAVVIGRTVLEWRLDPQSPDRIPEATYDRPIVVVCQEGYSSSLAAATLQLLGLRHATDLDGGVDAWIESGRPMAPTPGRPAPRPSNPGPATPRPPAPRTPDPCPPGPPGELHHHGHESRTARISSP